MPVQNIVRGVRRERNGVRMESENAIFKGSTAQLLRQALSNHPSGRKP